MNTQFLTEFKAALVALLAVLNSTNSPIAPSQPSMFGKVLTNSFVESATIVPIILTNIPVQPKTNLIDDVTIKLLVTSGQVCRVRGHILGSGCGIMGCLVIHPDPMRYCRLCGETETRQVKEWE